MPPEQLEEETVQPSIPPQAAPDPNTLPSWLAQYAVLGLLAFGGGSVGTLATGRSTDVLEIELREVKEDLQRYHEDVEQITTELERRLDLVERQLAKMGDE